LSLEWLQSWQELDAARQEQLGEAIGRLLERGFVLKGSATAPNPLFRILEHNEEAARLYLRVIGWDLQIDRTSGFVQAVHPEGQGRVRLGKQASLLLCLLRLLYQQRADAADWDANATVEIRDIQEAYLTHASTTRPFSKQFLLTTLRRFHHLGLIALPRPFEPEADSSLELLPTLAAALPESALERVSARVEDYLVSATQNDHEADS